VFAYNNSIHPSTNETPFFLNYGFHPYMDEYILLLTCNINHKMVQKVYESFNHVKEFLLRSQELYKRSADRKRITAPSYSIDDLVWIQAPPSLNIESSSKLAPCKYGPYKVTNVLHNNNYEIELKNSPFPKHHNVFHVSELEPFTPVPEKFRKRYKDPESIKDIIEIAGFRTNYKKKQYEYKILYKYHSSYNWVSSSEVDNNPRNQNIFIKYINNNRKPVSISYSL